MSQRIRQNTAAAVLGGAVGAVSAFLLYWGTKMNMSISELWGPHGNEHWDAIFYWLVKDSAIAGLLSAAYKDRPSSNEKVVSHVPDIDLGETQENQLKKKLRDFGDTAEIPKNHFAEHELTCHGQECDCTFIGMDDTTMAIANQVRDRFGKMFVQSAYRCPAHNATVKGSSKNSYHMLGQAIDLRPANVKPEIVYRWLCTQYPKQYGFGLYKSFVHIDSRTNAYARKDGADSQWHQFALPSPNN